MHADRLVAAADKYGLVILKAYCEDALKGIHRLGPHIENIVKCRQRHEFNDF